MTDRATLEARATELGIKFTDNWKDETLENRIAAQEKANNEDAPKGQPPASDDQAVDDKNGAPEGGKTIENREDQEQSKSGGYVNITGPAKGRWRIGKHFTRETQRIELANLKDGQLDALKADPELVVSVVPA
jgi:hypothetical protein